MLSRVAHSLYWLSRYLERGENLARLVEVNRYGALDAVSENKREQIWRQALAMTCSEELYESAREALDTDLDAGEFITFSKDNPDSIRACIANARNNARMARDQISEEMWVELNRTHLFLQSNQAEDLWKVRPEALYREVIRFCLLFEGLSEATILRDDGWHFLQLGKFLERADKTSRFLDTLTFDIAPDQTQLAAVLRSCSGFVAFRREFRGDITLSNVISFLLFSPSFPRSVRFCVRQVDEVLHDLSGYPIGSFANEAERLTGTLLAQLNFPNAGILELDGLHEYIDDLQGKLNDIGQQLFETYVLLPSEIQERVRPGTWPGVWQQQQQQQ